MAKSKMIALVSPFTGDARAGSPIARGAIAVKANVTGDAIETVDGGTVDAVCGASLLRVH